MRNRIWPWVTLAPSSYSRLRRSPLTSGRISTSRKPATRPAYSTGGERFREGVDVHPTCDECVSHRAAIVLRCGGAVEWEDAMSTYRVEVVKAELVGLWRAYWE